ncbi:MAG: DegT/DnrJ/EryC1/StrS family aminotransferase [Deltaproteobacteria bacterium]|nr:DegT/DnrJ/EryC1/StrS family aminotransferase [Deltaproteobacteria bacterium]
MPTGKRIPIARPVFDQADLESVTYPLKSGWVAQGPWVKRFEQAVASFCGTEFAVAVSSCTAALHLGLIALGVQEGDEVVVPSFTYVATANAVEYCRARPIFCDVSPADLTMDLELLEKSITPRTKVIIPVSLFGVPVDMSAVKEVSEPHGLLVLEDAACSLGAFFNGIHTGTEARAAAFSFHPRKIITTGEGGMLITNDIQLIDKVRQLRDHGASRSDLERHLGRGGSLLPDFDVLGYNYRMTDIQGALGVSQMSKLNLFLAARLEAAMRYDTLLADLEWVIPLHAAQGATSSYQSYVIVICRKDKRWPSLKEVDELNLFRNGLMVQLEELGISTRQGTHAVHTLGYYKNRYGFRDEDFPISFMSDRLSLALPLYDGITFDDQVYIVESLVRAGGPGRTW